MELCGEAERKPWSRVSKIWWEHEGIDFAGARVASIVEETDWMEKGGEADD